MKTPEQRERARLRSERYRRSRGIGPRRPAQKPWLGLGISRSTFYRRGNRIGAAKIYDAQEKAKGLLKRGKESPRSDEQTTAKTLADLGTNKQEMAVLDRAESSLTRLTRELTAAAGHMRVSASILREFPS